MLEATDEPPPLLHPGMAELYRQKVTDLATALEHPDTRTEAAESIRGLIDAVVLTPAEGAIQADVVRRGRPASSRGPAGAGHYDGAGDSGLQIELKGNLAAMLCAAQNRNEVAGDRRPRIADSDGCGGVQPAVLAAVEWGCMTPGGGPRDFEARRRKHGSSTQYLVSFQGRADRLELLVVDQPQQGPAAGESKSDAQNSEYRSVRTRAIRRTTLDSAATIDGPTCPL